MNDWPRLLGLAVAHFAAVFFSSSSLSSPSTAFSSPFSRAEPFFERGTRSVLVEPVVNLFQPLGLVIVEFTSAAKKPRFGDNAGQPCRVLGVRSDDESNELRFSAVFSCIAHLSGSSPARIRSAAACRRSVRWSLLPHPESPGRRAIRMGPAPGASSRRQSGSKLPHSKVLKQPIRKPR